MSSDTQLQHELSKLTARTVENDQTDAEAQRLEQLLTDHPELIDDYVESMSIRSSLRSEYVEVKATQLVDSLYELSPEPIVAEASMNHRRRSPIVYALAAAAVLLAAGLWALAPWASPQKQVEQEQPVAQQPVQPVQPVLSPVATLTTTDDVVWALDPLRPGQDFAAQTLRIVSGQAGFILASGTEVQLEGDVALRVDDSMNVTLMHGRADFVCPPGAEGFTVHGPQGVRVVDLGTRFSMQSQPAGPSRVHVREGRVRIEQPGMDTPIELTTGWTVRVDPQTRQVHPYIVEHFGMQDPQQAMPAWSLTQGDSTRVAPIHETSAAGEPMAWEIEDHGTAQGQTVLYSYKLTDQQVRRPWRLSARVRIIESTGNNQVLHVDDGERRWALWLHPDRIRTRGTTGNFIDLATGLDLSSNYHDVEIVYADDQAVFLLDGSEIGHIEREKTMGRTYEPQVRFGAGSSATTSRARWSFVQFASAGSDHPDQNTLKQTPGKN